MLKSYKYRLNPTSEQIFLMEKTFGSTRFIYNWALQTKIEAYQKDKTSLTAIDLCKKLTELKKQEEYSWLSEVSNECLQQSIRNMDQAFVRFFREKKGFPKFKSKKRSRNSFKNILNVYVDFDGRGCEASSYTDLGWYMITF